MIEGLKDDRIIHLAGGRFKLTALIQRRLVEIMQGARPMVEAKGLTLMEIVVREILEGKITLQLLDPTKDLEGEDEAEG